MRLAGFAVGAAIVAASFWVGGQKAAAQQPSGQFYGYASGQAPVPSGQAGVACHGCQPTPPPPCQPEQCGGYVVHCPPGPIPGIPNPPFESCQNCQNALTVYNECAPSRPTAWVTIYRNHYVPIRVVNVSAQHDVQPVNIQVKTRIVHYLCDCAPGTADCPHLPSAQASGQAKAEPAQAPPTAVAAAPPADAAAPAQSNTPPKRWVLLPKQGLYGFGYQRPDGLWVIDPSSKRAAPPADMTTPPASLSAASVPATASNES